MQCKKGNHSRRQGHVKARDTPRQERHDYHAAARTHTCIPQKTTGDFTCNSRPRARSGLMGRPPCAANIVYNNNCCCERDDLHAVGSEGDREREWVACRPDVVAGIRYRGNAVDVKSRESDIVWWEMCVGKCEVTRMHRCVWRRRRCTTRPPRQTCEDDAVAASSVRHRHRHATDSDEQEQQSGPSNTRTTRTG